MSRRAVVAEMDWERRRIERDLHDGAQHHLVSLRLALGLVEHQVSTAQLDPARSRLTQIADQIEVAEEILAETAKGVSSPLLAELGLVRALRQELGGGQPPVPVDAAGVDEEQGIPADVQAAVYFCCLEAVNNARKHARPAIEFAGDVMGGCASRPQGAGLDTTAKNASPGAACARAPGWPRWAVGWRSFRARSGTTVEGSPRCGRDPNRPSGDGGSGFRPGVALMTPSVSVIDQSGRDARGPRALPRQRPGRGVARARRAPRRTPAGRRGRSAGCRQHHPGRSASGRPGGRPDQGPRGPPGGAADRHLRRRADRQHPEDPGPRGRPGGPGRCLDTAAAASPGGRQRTGGAAAAPVRTDHRGARPGRRAGRGRLDGRGYGVAERAAAEGHPTRVRRRCSVVVPVAGLLAAPRRTRRASTRHCAGWTRRAATWPPRRPPRARRSGAPVADQAPAHAPMDDAAEQDLLDGSARPASRPRPDPLRPGPDGRGPA